MRFFVSSTTALLMLVLSSVGATAQNKDTLSLDDFYELTSNKIEVATLASTDDDLVLYYYASDNRLWADVYLVPSKEFYKKFAMFFEIGSGAICYTTDGDQSSYDKENCSFYKKIDENTYSQKGLTWDNWETVSLIPASSLDAYVKENYGAQNTKSKNAGILSYDQLIELLQNKAIETEKTVVYFRVIDNYLWLDYYSKSNKRFSIKHAVFVEKENGVFCQGDHKYKTDFTKKDCAYFRSNSENTYSRKRLDESSWSDDRKLISASSLMEYVEENHDPYDSNVWGPYKSRPKKLTEEVLNYTVTGVLEGNESKFWIADPSNTCKLKMKGSSANIARVTDFDFSQINQTALKIDTQFLNNPLLRLGGSYQVTVQEGPKILFHMEPGLVDAYRLKKAWSLAMKECASKKSRF